MAVKLRATAFVRLECQGPHGVTAQPRRAEGVPFLRGRGGAGSQPLDGVQARPARGDVSASSQRSLAAEGEVAQVLPGASHPRTGPLPAFRCLPFGAHPRRTAVNTASVGLPGPFLACFVPRPQKWNSDSQRPPESVPTRCRHAGGPGAPTLLSGNLAKWLGGGTEGDPAWP